MRPEVLHIRVGFPGAGVVQLRGSSSDLGGDDQGPAGGRLSASPPGPEENQAGAETGPPGWVHAVSCENDPEAFKQEALKYAKMCGDSYLHFYNTKLLSFPCVN